LASFSRNDRAPCPKLPASGRTTGPIKGDAVVFRAGRVEKATGPASQLQAIQLSSGCRVTKSGHLCQIVKHGKFCWIFIRNTVTFRLQPDHLFTFTPGLAGFTQRFL
jgi:hypothetical protein